jgi:hypothetical protein
VQALAGLSATAVAGTVFGVVELAHGRALEGALGLILALTCIPTGYATWSMRRTAGLHGSHERPEGTDVPARRVSRWPNGPFARVELAAGLPEPSLVTLLVLFVLTCDRDLANTVPGG